MKMKYIDYGEICAADEEMIQTRILRDDEPIMAFSVKTGDENSCTILSGHPKVTAEITVKKDEEYSGDVELPVLPTFDGNALHMEFRIKDYDGRRKTGFYWVYDVNNE